jgi:hypothetical protein
LQAAIKAKETVMKNVAKLLAVAAVAATSFSLPVLADSQRQAPRAYNVEETAAAARSNAGYRADTPTGSQWRAHMQHDMHSDAYGAQQPERGYGF